MRVPKTPAPRRGPPPPRRRQHSRICRTPHTPRASERAAGALALGRSTRPTTGVPAPQNSSFRPRTWPSTNRFAALRGKASHRLRCGPKRGSLPPHGLHRRLLRSRSLLRPHGAALHALHGLRLLAAYKFAPGSSKIMKSAKKETIK